MYHLTTARYLKNKMYPRLGDDEVCRLPKRNLRLPQRSVGTRRMTRPARPQEFNAR